MTSRQAPGRTVGHISSYGREAFPFTWTTLHADIATRHRPMQLTSVVRVDLVGPWRHSGLAELGVRITN